MAEQRYKEVNTEEADYALIGCGNHKQSVKLERTELLKTGVAFYACPKEDCDTYITVALGENTPTEPDEEDGDSGGEA